MSEQSAVTFLFTDIEGSTRLWEQEPERMRPAIAQHDALSRAVVERNRGTVVKMRGDGVHAAFANSLDALIATIELQQMLQSPDATGGLQLRLRCGLHAGAHERRDGDFYGRTVNRAARIVDAAHGGQTLLSKAVADQVSGALPESVTLRDLGTVRLRDLSEPERVYQLQHPKLRTEFPALRSLEATPNNLTQQLNSFIGREREMAEVKQMLATNRLVTLLGMGGIGKSRLSVQLAAEVLEDFPDGVWFIELAALTDPSSVPQAVASVLGVKEEAGRPVIEALTKYVRDLQVLIVLDNCEQVIHGCADVAKRLLQAGSKVKVLASSRDYLRIAGETTYQVPTLSVPKKEISLEALGQHEAVRLFIDRAAASMRGFGLTQQNAAAVADICFCLDGIPLAIELAAARVRALSVQAIASRLNDRFKLLVTSDQTVLPRQRTLRALIDWSYELLTEPERVLFRRLSVFAGGWTLEAAEAVCAHDNVTQTEVLDLLTQLVEKSLVIMEFGTERYGMLDTVRSYAQQKLAEASDQQTVRTRHLEFFMSYAEQARSEFGSASHEAALTRLDLVRDNLLAAHSNVTTAKEVDYDLRLTNALKSYWINRGLFAQGRQVALETLHRIDTDRRDFSTGRALFNAGQLCCFMGLYDEAVKHLEGALSIARELGEKSSIVSVLQTLAMSAEGLRDFSQARAYAEEAVVIAREVDRPRELFTALVALGQLGRIEGRPEVAQEVFHEALGLTRGLADEENTAVCLLNLAMVAINLGDHIRAQHMLREALTIAARTGSRRIGQSALETTAGLCASRGDWANAIKLHGAAQAQAQAAGLRADAADLAFLVPLIAQARRAATAADVEALEAAGLALTYEQALTQAETCANEVTSAMVI